MTLDLKTHRVFVLVKWEEPRGFTADSATQAALES